MINAVPSGNSPTNTSPPANSGAEPVVGSKPSNTKPETKHKPPVDTGIRKPGVDSVSTPPGTHPDLNMNTQPGKSNPAAAHGQTGRFAGDLAKKVQGKDSDSGIPTPPGMTGRSGMNGSSGTMGGPPMTNYPDKTLDEINQDHQRGGPKFAKTAIVSALVLGLVIAGSGAGYYLTQQNQDIREQAASEEVTQTEMIGDQQDWIAFNVKWQDVMADKNNTWEDYVSYAQGEGARYKCDAPIMTVGEETLYGCDLNALFVLYEAEAYAQPNSISPQDSTLNQVLDKLVTDSAILQKGSELGLVTLDSTIFNSPSKDTFARFAQLKSLRPMVQDQLVKTYDFEVISIYFHNEEPPEIPLSEAQAAAKAKMDVLYERLKSGEITMQEAGAEIAADSINGDSTGVSLAQLDSLYAENSYSSVQNKDFGDPVFTDYTLDEEIKSLGEGQMSTVRLCKDQKFTTEEFVNDPAVAINSPFVDSCYMIFKVNKINLGLEGQQSPETAAEAEQTIYQEFQTSTQINTENLEQ